MTLRHIMYVLVSACVPVLLLYLMRFTFTFILFFFLPIILLLCVPVWVKIHLNMSHKIHLLSFPQCEDDQGNGYMCVLVSQCVYVTRFSIMYRSLEHRTRCTHFDHPVFAGSWKINCKTKFTSLTLFKKLWHMSVS